MGWFPVEKSLRSMEREGKQALALHGIRGDLLPLEKGEWDPIKPELLEETSNIHGFRTS